MSNIQLCLFSSTPDMAALDFVVKVLTGSPEELAQTAVAWGYDGIEFMPNPESIPDPQELETALQMTGAIMPVVNSGRMFAQGLALLHDDPNVRRRSIRVLKEFLDFAGYFKARVGLGIARGGASPTASPEDMDQLADDIFREVAAHAEQVGAIIMLEPADPGFTGYVNTMDEAMAWVVKINSPAFTVMLDTYQLVESEPSLEYGIRAAQGRADHIHLYDPSRWPPGVLVEQERLDWPHIMQLLKEEGFQGTASVVLAPEGDPESAARTALNYLRSFI